MSIPTKWQQRFMQMAFTCASWSKDPSTKVGAVISEGNRIISMGFNGYPHGVEDTLDPREVKYMKTLHGEENALLHAQRDLRGCALFATNMPCPNCAAKIIQVGITDVYAPPQTEDYLSRWGEKVKVSLDMFVQAGVTVHHVDMDLTPQS
jgi:dCMP deaminase